MSAHYDLVPLSEILVRTKQRAWLEGMGLTIPASWEQSRHPTTREVRAAVAALAAEQRLAVEDDFRIRGDDLDAILVSGDDSTFLSVRDYARDRNDDAAHGVSFQYGEAELVVTVAERLARARWKPASPPVERTSTRRPSPVRDQEAKSGTHPMMLPGRPRVVLDSGRG